MKAVAARQDIFIVDATHQPSINLPAVNRMKFNIQTGRCSKHISKPSTSSRFLGVVLPACVLCVDQAIAVRMITTSLGERERTISLWRPCTSRPGAQQSCQRTHLPLGNIQSSTRARPAQNRFGSLSTCSKRRFRGSSASGW
jgi:hypothetical protein